MNRPTHVLTHVLLRIIPVAVVILFIIWLSVRTLAEQAVREIENRRLAVEARHAADLTSQKLQSLKATTELLASNDLVVNGLIDFEGRSNYLPSFFQSLHIPGLEGAIVTLVDYRGRSIVSNHKKIPDYSDSAWLSDLADGHDIFHFTTTGALHVVKPIIYLDSTEGALIVEYGPEDVRSLLANAIKPKVANNLNSFFILDTDKQEVFFSSNPTLVEAGDMDPGSEIERWIQIRERVPEFPNLLLVSAEPVEIAFAVVNTVTRLLVTALILNLLLLIVGLVLTARLVTKPLSTFIQNIDQIRGANDLKSWMPASNMVELNDLSTAFNGMLKDLQKTTVSRNYVDNIIKSMIDSLVVVSVDGYIQTVNPATCALLGYEETQLIGRPLELILPECTFLFEEIKQLTGPETRSESDPVSTSLAQNLETTYRSASGSKIPILFSSSVMYNPDGQMLAVVCVAQDISERKWVEHALQESEAEARKLAMVASRTDNAVIITDAVGHIEWVNEGFTRITEYGLEEVTGKTPGSFLQGPESDPLIIEQISAHVKNGQGFQVEIINYAKSGRKYWLTIDAQPIHDEQGQLINFIALEGDITERKQAEEALRESEARLAQFLEALPLGVYVLDTNGKPYFANQVSQQILGRGVAPDATADQLSEIYQVYMAGTNQPYPTDQLPVVRALAGESCMVNDIEVRPGGQAKPLEVLARPIYDQAGKVVYAIAAFQDISERREAEKQLKSLNEELEARVEKRTGELLKINAKMQTEITERLTAEAALKQERTTLAQRVEERTAKLSQANAELARVARLKDEFLASMSHELRTPLNAILGMSEALQEQLYGPLNEDQLDFLHDIEESGRHLLSLINDILDLSKIEAGKLELQIDEVGVEPVCQASLRLIKQSAHKKNLKVISNFDSSVTSLYVDERQLKQILVNLLSNAVKFTPSEGTVGLDVVGDKARESVYFTVWDTGIGIPPEDMDRLFQPFVQLDSSLARHHAGTGLGLALVYRLTELHGGSVAVESKAGEGSRFIVSLPWSDISIPPDDDPEEEEEELEEEIQVEPPPVPHSAADSVILLAEDNEMNIKTTTHYLQGKGYTVVVARNGLEAIDRAKELYPDLILMDIQMPGMDGLEATRRLRADADLAEIPIIALTALAMPGDHERIVAAGVDSYLSKPVSFRELVKVIEHYLDLQVVQ